MDKEEPQQMCRRSRRNGRWMNGSPTDPVRKGEGGGEETPVGEKEAAFWRKSCTQYTNFFTSLSLLLCRNVLIHRAYIVDRSPTTNPMVNSVSTIAYKIQSISICCTYCSNYLWRRQHHRCWEKCTHGVCKKYVYYSGWRKIYVQCRVERNITYAAGVAFSPLSSRLR